MAKGDVFWIDTGGKTNVPVRTFRTRAGETAINPGEPLLISNLGDITQPYVIALTDGKPSVGADYFIGVSANSSSHTASADGNVDVYLETPGTIWAAKAKTTTTFDSAGDVNDNLFYRIVFDLTSSTYTADVAADVATRGLRVVGGDHTTYTVYFTACDGASWDR